MRLEEVVAGAGTDRGSQIEVLELVVVEVEQTRKEPLPCQIALVLVLEAPVRRRGVPVRLGPIHLALHRHVVVAEGGPEVPAHGQILGVGVTAGGVETQFEAGLVPVVRPRLLHVVNGVEVEPRTGRFAGDRRLVAVFGRRRGFPGPHLSVRVPEDIAGHLPPVIELDQNWPRGLDRLDVLEVDLDLVGEVRVEVQRVAVELDQLSRGAISALHVNGVRPGRRSKGDQGDRNHASLQYVHSLLRCLRCLCRDRCSFAKDEGFYPPLFRASLGPSIGAAPSSEQSSPRKGNHRVSVTKFAEGTNSPQA